jgi:hypothetical protein
MILYLPFLICVIIFLLITDPRGLMTAARVVLRTLPEQTKRPSIFTERKTILLKIN